MFIWVRMIFKEIGCLKNGLFYNIEFWFWDWGRDIWKGVLLKLNDKRLLKNIKKLEKINIEKK